MKKDRRNRMRRLCIFRIYKYSIYSQCCIPFIFDSEFILCKTVSYVTVASQVIMISYTGLGYTVSLLFSANSVIFQLYHGDNKLIFNEMMMRSALY